MPRDAAHERSLVRYLKYQVRPYSARYRHVLQSTPVTRAEDLSRLPLATLDDWGDPGQLVLRPTKDTILSGGELTLRAQLVWSMLWRREPALASRVIDPTYKPVHWVSEAGVAMGYSAEDVERLAEVGRLRLQSAGVTIHDVVVGVVGRAAPLAFWQLALGTRRGGVAALLLDRAPEPLELLRLAPTVLAGTSRELERVLDECRAEGIELGSLRTLLVTGERLDAERRGALATAAAPSNAAVVTWWAPPGVRSLWGECRSGTSFHLVPSVDHTELIDGAGASVVEGEEGEIVWTPLAWKGTVLLRLRTGVTGRMAAGACRSCGATAPRLEITEVAPARSRRPRAGTRRRRA